MQIARLAPLNKWEKQIRLWVEKLAYLRWAWPLSLKMHLRKAQQHPDWVEMKQYTRETLKDWPRSILAPIAGSSLLAVTLSLLLHNLLHWIGLS